MPIIGLLSDTHGYLHPKVTEFFAGCDEIWHAGDIGNVETATDIRVSYPRYQLFSSGELKVLITHIGGYPGRYEPDVRQLIDKEHPGLFISGHSHILKVIYDQKNQLLHINPGAAGNSGMHRVITFVRFVIEGKNIRDLEIFEAERNQQLREY